jgi:hypothetical protein
MKIFITVYIRVFLDFFSSIRIIKCHKQNNKVYTIVSQALRYNYEV